MRRTYKNPGPARRTMRPCASTPRSPSLLRDDLETWQRLNVTAFLSSGVAADPGADRRALRRRRRHPLPADVPPAGAGVRADKDALTAAHERAVRRGLPMAVFTAELFAHRARRGQPGRGGRGARAGWTWSGIAVHGPRNAVDKVTKGADAAPLGKVA